MLTLAACTSPRKEAWKAISPYFEVPAEYVGDFGDYRSPLLTRSGDTVRTAQEWLARRAEIRDEWFDIIGRWPEIIMDQDLEILDTCEYQGVTRHRIRLRWTPSDTTTGYLLIPHGRRTGLPAVISVFYEPETAIGLGDSPNRDFAIQLAKRGFVALSLGTTETTLSKTYSLYYPSIENASMQPLSALAYAAANALEALARHPAVDPDRIGIVGHSYGGKWAMFASCLYDRFACAAWSDPGIVFDETKGGYVNYWEPWYLGYYPPPWDNLWQENGYESARGAYATLREAGHDLHELHALMAPRPFLVSGGYSDGPERWRALNHTVEVNRVLGRTGDCGVFDEDRRTGDCGVLDEDGRTGDCRVFDEDRRTGDCGDGCGVECRFRDEDGRGVECRVRDEDGRTVDYENRVGMTTRPTHSPTELSNEIIYSFFEYFLEAR